MIGLMRLWRTWKEMEEIKANQQFFEENERLKDLNGIEKCFSVDKAFEGFHVSNVQSKRRALNVIKLMDIQNIYALKILQFKNYANGLRWVQHSCNYLYCYGTLQDDYGDSIKGTICLSMFLNQLTKRIEDNRKTVTFDI